MATAEELKIRITADDKASGPINKVRKDVEGLGEQAKQTAVTLAAANGKINNSFQKMSRGAGQAGIQVQQLVGQVQGGTNPMLALSQQATDLGFVLGFPLVGAVVGLGASLAMTLMPSLSDSKDAMEKLETATKDVDGALSDISSMDAIKKKYGAITNTIKEMIRFQNTAKIEAVREAGVAAIKKQVEELAVFDDLIEFGGKGAMEQFAKHLGVPVRGVDALKEAFNRLDKVPSFEGKAKELDNLFNVMQRMRSDESLNVTPAFKEIQAAIVAVGLEAEGSLTKIEQLQEAMKFRDTDATLSAREEAKKLIASLDPTAKYDAQLKRIKELKKMVPGLAKELDAVEKKVNAQIQKILDGNDEVAKARVKALKLIASLDPAAKYDEEIKAIDKLKAKAPELAEALTAVQQKLKDQRDAALGGKSALKEYAEASVDLQKSLESGALKGVKSLEDGLVDLISGTKNASLAFRDMARSIISDLIRMQVQQSITQPLAGFLNQFVPNVANSIGSFRFGGTPTLSSSNYIGSGGPAQTFPYEGSWAGGGFTGNGPRSGGVDGKGGFPAILHPNETVIDHAQGQSAGTVINQTINITTGVQQTVRTEIMTLLPQIAEASKAAVLDARRRGGSFAGAF